MHPFGTRATVHARYAETRLAAHRSDHSSEVSRVLGPSGCIRTAQAHSSPGQPNEGHGPGQPHIRRGPADGILSPHQRQTLVRPRSIGDRARRRLRPQNLRRLHPTQSISCRTALIVPRLQMVAPLSTATSTVRRNHVFDVAFLHQTRAQPPSPLMRSVQDLRALRRVCVRTASVCVSKSPLLCQPVIHQARDAVNPSHASPAATTQATQLAHSGIAVSPAVTGKPITARINCRRATSAKIAPTRRE